MITAFVLLAVSLLIVGGALWATNYEYEGLGAILVCAGVLLLLGLAIFKGAQADSAEHARLMKQCLGDGRKEYECEGMLTRPKSSTTVIPMPVYMGR